MTEEAIHKLKDLAVSDTGFVFDPYTGTTFSTNATGKCILDALKEGLSRSELMSRLEEGFNTHEDDLQRDVDDFLHQLRKHGLVPESFHV